MDLLKVATWHVMNSVTPKVVLLLLLFCCFAALIAFGMVWGVCDALTVKLI
jgi:hypothetical protein